MKGGYGRTRWIPVLPELERALLSYLSWLRQRFELTQDMPLFISREGDADGKLRPLTRESAGVSCTKPSRRRGLRTWSSQYAHSAEDLGPEGLPE